MSIDVFRVKWIKQSDCWEKQSDYWEEEYLKLKEQISIQKELEAEKGSEGDE